MITVTPNGLAFAIRLAPYGSGLLWWLTGTLGPGLTGGGDPGEVRDGERFPAGAGVDPGRAQDPLGVGGAARPARQRGAEGLAALGERGVDDGEGVLAARPGGSRVPGERHQARVHVRHRPEHRPGHRPGPARRGEPGQLD